MAGKNGIIKKICEINSVLNKQWPKDKVKRKIRSFDFFFLLFETKQQNSQTYIDREVGKTQITEAEKEL